MSEEHGSVPVIRASTLTQPEPERFEYFCDAICDVYLGIRPERTTDRPFDADVIAHAWGSSVLGRISAPGHDARRDRRLIAAKPDSSLFLNFTDITGFHAEHLGSTWGVAPMAPLLLDNEAPFHLRFDPDRRFRLYSLSIPRTFNGTAPSAKAVARLNDRIRVTRIGRQLAAQTRLMSAELEAGRPELARTMSDAVIGLLRVLLDEDEEGGDRAGGVLRIDSYKQAARVHLGDERFGVRELARVFGVSARTVQTAFAVEDETFSEWIQVERLELACDRVRSPEWSGRSIAAVAASCGFGDVSHFHRAFRRRFGEPPGAFRPIG